MSNLPDSKECYDDIDGAIQCDVCLGTGMMFEGDIHVGDCENCGGDGYTDE